ncbi:hypothetical protein FHS09_004600 [Microbulbifer rhizosphaerae]|uniref:Uncharacterized protein n=1 Tax=Microbulbifer rhizosphaerae TaxID=1562603 RepID=A0A7W4WGD6_9GAMM|nr:hypothetical protein [Microbulbifer rhizosphaerae]
MFCVNSYELMAHLMHNVASSGGRSAFCAKRIA